MKKVLYFFISLMITSCFIYVIPHNVSAAFNVYDFVYSSDCFYDFEIYTNSIDYNLWDKFIKYDLCITDYESLTDEEKKLCKFIFEHERAANQTIRCERARRILAGYNVGKRLTLSDVRDKGSIIAPYELSIGIVDNYVEGVPDIVHLDSEVVDTNEYWLDDDGKKRILFNPHYSSFGYIEYLDEADVNMTDSNIYYTPDEIWLKYENIERNQTVINKEDYSDGWGYHVLKDGTVAITSNPFIQKYPCEPLEETIVIPSEIDGYNVSALACSFSSTGVSKVILPKTLKIIGEYSFAECNYLTEIEINCPDAKICDNAFYKSGLKNVFINVKEISKNAFSNCEELESVVIKSSEEINFGAFKNCINLKSVELPEDLKVIGQGAFYNTSVKNFEFGSNIKIIGMLSERQGSVSGGLSDFPSTDPLIDKPLCVVDYDCTINGWYGTEAHSYALAHNLKFNPLDDITYGDVNNDDEINITDAVALKKYLIKSDTVGYEADFNRDGRINVFDMILLKRNLINSKA